MHTVVAGDGAVGSLSLNTAVGRLEHRGHETKGTIALSDDIRLNITVVIFAGPDEATAGLDSVRDEIINEAVLIPEAGSLELSLVVTILDLLEDVLEATVVPLQNGVLGGEIAREAAGKSVLER